MEGTMGGDNEPGENFDFGIQPELFKRSLGLWGRQTKPKTWKNMAEQLLHWNLLLPGRSRIQNLRRMRDNESFWHSGQKLPVVIYLPL